MKEKSLTSKAIETKEKILNSALGLFSRKGYGSTSMREIADGADVSVGLSYRYFNTKKEIMQQLLARHVGHLKAAMQMLEIDSYDNENLADSFLELIKNQKKEFRLFCVAILQPGMFDLKETELELVFTEIEEVAATITGNKPGSIAGKAVTSLIMGAIFNYLSNPARYSEEVVHDIFDYIMPKVI